METVVDIHKLAVLEHDKIAFPSLVPAEGADHVIGVLVSARKP